MYGDHTRFQTYDKKQYFVTIVDDYRRYTLICLIQSKCEVCVVLLIINKEFGENMKCLRSKNSTKFFNA